VHVDTTGIPPPANHAMHAGPGSQGRGVITWSGRGLGGTIAGQTCSTIANPG
jgi:hypothetical protein